MIKSSMKLSLVGMMAILLLGACSHERNHPGYAYMPDMYYSEPYDAYSENPVFADSITNQAPPEGTIPLGYTPYPYKAKSFEDQQLAGLELVNPIEVVPDLLQQLPWSPWQRRWLPLYQQEIPCEAYYTG